LQRDDAAARILPEVAAIAADASGKKEVPKAVPPTNTQSSASGDKARSLIQAAVVRVVIEKGRLAITLTDATAATIGHAMLPVPWSPRPKKPKRDIILPLNSTVANPRPMHAERRAKHLRAIALGRKWLDELVSGKVTDVEAIAARENRSARSVHMTISLAFIAPDIIEAAVAGRLPRGIGLTRLVDLPPSWAKQRGSRSAGEVLDFSRTTTEGALSAVSCVHAEIPLPKRGEHPPSTAHPSKHRPGLHQMRTTSPRRRVIECRKQFVGAGDKGPFPPAHSRSSPATKIPETKYPRRSPKCRGHLRCVRKPFGYMEMQLMDGGRDRD
jgi:hypothetical protein